MPVEPRIVGNKIRQVEAATGEIAKTKKGNPVDGGGWDNTQDGWKKANGQAKHINDSSRT